jgi:hypothetical protein
MRTVFWALLALVPLALLLLSLQRRSTGRINQAYAPTASLPQVLWLALKEGLGKVFLKSCCLSGSRQRYSSVATSMVTTACTTACS